MRHHIELSHEITTLYNWSTNPDRDTVSALSDKQAREAVIYLKEIWSILERRRKRV